MITEPPLGSLLRMHILKPIKINVGDRIVFKAATRAGNPKLTRVVNGFWPNGNPTVRAHGFPDFVVDWKEISAVIPQHHH